MKFNSVVLKDLRVKKKMSLIFLSKDLYKETGLNVSHETLRRWEEGITFPSVLEISKLASFYKRSVSFFFEKKVYLTGKVK